MSKTVQGRNGAHNKASKRRKKQKNRLIIVVIEILVLLILAAVLFVTVKLSKIQKDTSFNKEDIEVKYKGTRCPVDICSVPTEAAAETKKNL